MSSVVDAMIEPILLVPPFFDIPPFTEVICSVVELIKGGQIEEIPGIGQIIKYGREGILIFLLLFVLFIKAFQYISPIIWHFAENLKPRHPTKPVFNKDDCTGFCGVTDYGSYALKYLEWIPVGFINWCITVFIQIPFDILAWDLESLSVDFGNLWGSEKNIFREDCRRFINGSYAGDFSLYEDEDIHKYLLDSESDTYNDKYLNSDSTPKRYYLCTHGNWCEDIADVFGKTMMGRNSSLTDDNSPTNGFMNGINVSSAPRKYAVCCDGIPVEDCEKKCKEKSPIDINDLKNPASLIKNFTSFITSPIQSISEIIDIFAPPTLNLKDYEAIECNFQNSIHDFWKKQCTYKGGHTKGKSGIKKVFGFVEDIADRVESAALPCPDTVGFHKKTCSESMSDIGKHIKEAYDKRLSDCQEGCKTTNDQKLNARGCNSDNLEKAKRSVLRNRNDTLLSLLPRDYESNKIKNMAIKRTPWKSGERPPELNPDAEYNRGQQIIRTNKLTTKDGTDCSRHDLNDGELEKCFGPFRPMTPETYPILFYKITKDFMGSILWTIFIIFIIFIILYILCLFNPVGRAEYKLNENAGALEGGMKSIGMDMGDLNTGGLNIKGLNMDSLKGMVKSKLN